VETTRATTPDRQRLAHEPDAATAAALAGLKAHYADRCAEPDHAAADWQAVLADADAHPGVIFTPAPAPARAAGDAPIAATPAAGAARHAHGGEIERLRARIEALEAQNEAQRRRVSVLTKERGLITRALSNPHVKQECAVGLKTIWHVAAMLERGLSRDGFVRVDVWKIARKAGRSSGAAGRHLHRLHDLRVLELTIEEGLKEVIDTRTGRMKTRPDTKYWVRIDSKEAALKRLAYAAPPAAGDEPDPPKRRGWGGKRVRCPIHPGAERIRRVHCAVCNRQLGPDLPLDPVPPDPPDDPSGSEQFQDEIEAATPGASPWPSAPTPATGDPSGSEHVQDERHRSTYMYGVQDEIATMPNHPPASGPLPLCAECGNRTSVPHQPRCQACILAALRPARGP
jgi:hypothetical protein